MGRAEDKAVAARIPLEVFNQGRTDVVDEVAAPDYIEHTEIPGFPSTVEGFKQFVLVLRSAFPDFTYRIDLAVAEDDLVVQYLQATGTMRGDFLGMTATGKSATWNETHIVRIRDGRIAEHWGVIDQLSMLQQLGVIPMPGAAPV